MVETLAALIRRASTELPPDIAAALVAARDREPVGSGAAFTLAALLDNAALAADTVVPMCQDTGTLSFWFDLPRGADPLAYEDAAREAVRAATRDGCLRLNVIAPDGSQISDNVADCNPAIHLRFHADPSAPARATLLMKGGGSENMSRQYSLPDTELAAGRDPDGVRKCVLDAIWRAQGNGCAPGIIGVCVGGDRAAGFEKAKEQLLRPLDDTNPDPALASLETRLFTEANSLGIGPMGLGGATTILGVKLCAAARLPASYFVTIAYSCWACRRASAAI